MDVLPEGGELQEPASGRSRRRRHELGVVGVIHQKQLRQPGRFLPVAGTLPTVSGTDDGQQDDDDAAQTAWSVDHHGFRL